MDLLELLVLRRGRSQGFYMRDNRKYSRFDIGQGAYGSPTVRAWGDWPAEKIEREIQNLLNDDVAGFIAKHLKGNDK